MNLLYKTPNAFLQLIFLVAFVFQLNSQPNYPREVAKAELIASDISNFIVAYEQLKPGIDTISVLKEKYFAKASDGMTEYIARHGLTPELLKEAMGKNPDAYSRISDFYKNLSGIDTLFRNTLTAYKGVIPNTMFAPTYLIVGANRGIAQASRYGQLITITRLLDNPEKLIKVIVHELTHFQQAMTIGPQKYAALYAAKDNMLELCLREGGAEFITFLVLNDITQKRPLKYFEDHETELTQRFLNDLKNQDSSYWLWESIGKDKDQHLLGYVMGFKICHSYYNSSLNNDEDAVKEILMMADANEFMAKSGYFE